MSRIVKAIVPWGTLAFRVYVSEVGLCHVALPGEPEEQSQRWLTKAFGKGLRIIDGSNTVAERDSHLEQGVQDIVQPVTDALKAYFAGARQSFADLTLDLRGTPFQTRVWQAVAEIPYGSTVSYGELARTLNMPRAARAIGAANGANPIPIVVPCHRVIGGSGQLTGYRGGIPLKERLLQHEHDGPNASGAAQ